MFSNETFYAVLLMQGRRQPSMTGIGKALRQLIVFFGSFFKPLTSINILLFLVV